MTSIHRYLLGALALAATVATFWFCGDIVFYILIAGVLAIMSQPLVGKVASVKVFNRPLPRWLAAVVGVLAVWLVIALFFVLFIPLISSKLSDLAHLDYQSMLAPLREPMTDLGLFLDKYFKINISESSLTEMFAGYVHDFAEKGSLTSLVSSIFSVAGSVVVAAVSITFIAFWFMKEEGLFLRILLAVAPTKYEENVKRAVTSITALLSRYFIGVLIQIVVMMCVVTTILLCFGFKFQDALFVGFVEGVFNIIPYVGPWIGFILSALSGLTFVDASGMTLTYVVVAIAITILVAQAIDNYFISPKVFSRQVNAHPLEIFIVTLVAGSCSGVLGMLIAIPAYTVLRVLAKEFFYNYKLVRKLTSNV